ncbi:MAG TPA: hypothetical protein DD723_03265 [Candidatus Omnitrophica bacterium]|nr:MAG: hypothetical protein A2Z81_01010 [Omnitrophica WOR_2 bacterium GWA2_45_18]OGX19274.1 MAG: hypothetical protein A2Y04_00320 [Omnitrophica WOR_2 bacterium GWC2_45_7]HBR14549.1 hypothetical protein [Candidatus Omnitrophota bacterium]
MRIKTKIFLTLLIGAVILITVANGILFYFSANYIKDEVYDHLELAAQSKARHVETFLEMMQGRMMDFSSDGYIKNCLAEMNGVSDGSMDPMVITCTADTLSQHLRINKLPAIEGAGEIFVLDLGGKVSASSMNERIGRDESQSLYFLKGKESILLSDIFFSKEYQQNFFTVSAPVRKENRLVGIVAGKISPQMLYAILREPVGLGQTGEMYLVNKEGFMISPSRFVEHVILAKQIDPNVIQGVSDHWGKMSFLKKGQRWHNNFLVYKNYRGATVLGTLAYVPAMAWYLVVETQMSEIFSPLVQLLWSFILVGVLSLCLIYVVSNRIGQKISDPIERLQSGTEIITRGNLDHHLKVETNDEIGQLTKSFNYMTDKLRETNQRLEEKIRDFALNLKLSERQNKILEDTKKATLNLLEDLREERRKLEESEVKIRSVVENAVDGIIVINSQGIIDSFNAAAARIFGYEAKDVLGQNIKMLMPEPYRGQHDSYLKRYKETGEKRIIGSGREVHGQHKDGTVFPLDLAVNEMKIGERTMFTGIVRDITDRKMTQERLRLQAKALESAANVIIITDTSGIIRWVNPAFTKVTGYMPQEAIGRKSSLINSGKQPKFIYEKLWRMIMDGQVWQGELINRRKDGTFYYVDLTITPVFDENGGIVSYIGISQDITDRKKAEQQMIQQKENLEKVNLELDSFVYTASHDLRAPLRGIASFATFLEEDYKDKLDAEGKDYLNEIRKGADRLSALIDDLLTLSRIARIKNPYEKVDIRTLIEAVRERLEFDIKESKVELGVQENLPLLVCDRIKLGEVFVNLINNSIKFSSKSNKENPKVDIGYNEREKFYEFYVKDNGIGIDPQYHERIFEIFKRLHKPGEYEGTGAGLSIVKRIVEDHGGRVWVESRLGQGAVFYFTIPKDLKIENEEEENLADGNYLSQSALKEKNMKET